MALTNHSPADFWPIDRETCEKLQPLKRFVEFVTGLKYATPAQKQHKEELLFLIENLHDPTTYKEWNIWLDLQERWYSFDDGIPYWRCWWVGFDFIGQR